MDSSAQGLIDQFAASLQTLTAVVHDRELLAVIATLRMSLCSSSRFPSIRLCSCFLLYLLVSLLSFLFHFVGHVYRLLIFLFFFPSCIYTYVAFTPNCYLSSVGISGTDAPS